MATAEVLLPYSSDDNIAAFFAAHAPVTRAQCDEHAAALLAERGLSTVIAPVPMQGESSYTVMTVSADGESDVGGGKVVQFRAAGSDLDRDMLELARATHPGFVPAWSYHGLFQDRLPVYVMDKLPGVPFIKVLPSQGVSTEPWYSRTIADLARFFAQSWNARQQMSREKADALLHEYTTKLNLLAAGLPARFRPNLDTVIAGVPKLFADGFPLVLDHGDLSVLNVFVEEGTGRITGVVDWAEASVAPFGIGLWGLEEGLGVQNRNGWRYYANYEELRSLFWETIEASVVGGGGDKLSAEEKRLVDVARMAGIFLRHGLKSRNGALVVVKEGTTSMCYLDAFCLGTASSASKV